MSLNYRTSGIHQPRCLSRFQQCCHRPLVASASTVSSLHACFCRRPAVILIFTAIWNIAVPSWRWRRRECCLSSSRRRFGCWRCSSWRRNPRRDRPGWASGRDAFVWRIALRLQPRPGHFSAAKHQPIRASCWSVRDPPENPLIFSKMKNPHISLEVLHQFDVHYVEFGKLFRSAKRLERIPPKVATEVNE